MHRIPESCFPISLLPRLHGYSPVVCSFLHFLVIGFSLSHCARASQLRMFYEHFFSVVLEQRCELLLYEQHSWYGTRLDGAKNGLSRGEGILLAPVGGTTKDLVLS